MRTIVLATMVLFLVAAGAAAEEVAGLVLKDGTHMVVKAASVENHLVYATFADGRMQAYPVEEVDLAASGLLPEVVEAADKPLKRGRALADATSKPTGVAPAITITDQDVGHVDPMAGLEEDENEAPAGSSAALAITGTKHQIAGNVVNVTGKVVNVGSETVASITVLARAINASGEFGGSGSTTISEEIKPEDGVVFALSFPVLGDVADIEVSARAIMASFDFMKVESETDEDEFE